MNQNDHSHNEQILQLPAKRDGTAYSIDEANHDQLYIIADVLMTLDKWIQGALDYRPLRKTVCGRAGSGKSYLIHLITTLIRQKFASNATVVTSAFTGAAAFNIGGKTCHSAFGVNVMNPNEELSSKTTQRLMKELRHASVIIIDERSMLSCELLGAVERNVALTCHGGGSWNLDWGGVPVVMLFGDDHQLPPVMKGGKGMGAFDCLNQTYNKKRYFRQDVIMNGIIQFREFGKNVSSLTRIQRVSENDDEFITLLERIREGNPNEVDINTCNSLSLNRQPQRTQERILSDPTTLHLFASRKKCEDYNFMKLQEKHDENNPVAIIKHKLPKHMKRCSQDSLPIPHTAFLCRGAKVAIRGRNFNPIWGLHNGAIGTVIEIAYGENGNPNAGDLPEYVLVDFPSYTGWKSEHGSNIFDEVKPTHIPIPCITHYDGKSKRGIDICPLILSFARTIHTFQGYEAGSKNDTFSNPIKTLVCDTGTTTHEAMNPGLLYTAISRASTIGTEDDRSKSALFFINWDSTRLQYLTTSKSGKPYESVIKRKKWTEYLAHYEALTKAKRLPIETLEQYSKDSCKCTYTIQHIDDAVRKYSNSAVNLTTRS